MKRHATSLSVDDVAHALAASEGTVHVLVELLYACGGRVSEIAGLTWDKVNLEERWVRLQSKGAEERLVPLGVPCVAALRGFYGHRNGSELVFGGLTSQNVRDRLATLGRQIGVHLYPHAFRHAMATHLHDNGANERVIQELLGHRRVNTTMLYLDTSDRTILDNKALVTRCLANARGTGDDPRSLKRVVTGSNAGLILR